MNVTLLILLFLCHFLADYTHLSTKWMLDAKRIGKPLWPILCHAGNHDVLKGKCNVWFPSAANPANKLHWILFGFDQFLHAVVIILMAYFVI